MDQLAQHSHYLSLLRRLDTHWVQPSSAEQNKAWHYRRALSTLPFWGHLDLLASCLLAVIAAAMGGKHKPGMGCPTVLLQTRSRWGAGDQIPMQLKGWRIQHKALVGGFLERGCRGDTVCRNTISWAGSWVSTWNNTPVLLNKSHYRQDYTLAITFSLSDIKGRSLINK